MKWSNDHFFFLNPFEHLCDLDRTRSRQCKRLQRLPIKKDEPFDSSHFFNLVGFATVKVRKSFLYLFPSITRGISCKLEWVFLIPNPNPIFFVATEHFCHLLISYYTLIITDRTSLVNPFSQLFKKCKRLHFQRAGRKKFKFFTKKG